MVCDALEGAFYESFTAIEPSGARTLIGLDVSGSMSSPLMGSPLSVCEGAAAMAMATMRAEANWHVMAFDQGFRDLHLTAKMSLDQVTAKTRDVNGGGTDCALPMLWALEHKVDVDTFAVFTDSETWAGHVHPVRALQIYRQERVPHAKLVVVGMTSTGFTIADPEDAGMLDVVGFDSSAPAVIADFSRPS
jgi:60 kDa SS-A/Ro ribonucleoprotein